MKFIRFFNPMNKTRLGEPKPAKSMIPEWYRQSESFFEDSSGETHAGLKKCAPFLDTLISGYLLVTPFDIFVSIKEDGKLDIKWNGPQEYNSFIMERPNESGHLMPRPVEHFGNAPF